MKKILIWSIVVVLFITIFMPRKYVYTINKNEVYSIKPFGGRVNGYLTGTHLACDYWLEPDSVPTIVEYTVWTNNLFDPLGYVISVDSKVVVE